jgi:hypothetical protein
MVRQKHYKGTTGGHLPASPTSQVRPPYPGGQRQMKPWEGSCTDKPVQQVQGRWLQPAVFGCTPGLQNCDGISPQQQMHWLSRPTGDLSAFSVTLAACMLMDCLTNTRRAPARLAGHLCPSHLSYKYAPAYLRHQRVVVQPCGGGEGGGVKARPHTAAVLQGQDSVCSSISTQTQTRISVTHVIRPKCKGDTCRKTGLAELQGYAGANATTQAHAGKSTSRAGLECTPAHQWAEERSGGCSPAH